MGDATGAWWVNALSCARRRGLTRKDQDETRLCDVIPGFNKLTMQQGDLGGQAVHSLFDYFFVIIYILFLEISRD